MYARITIASNALDTSELSTPVANLVHRTAAEGVRVHGRLVFGNRQEAGELVAAIQRGAALPQDARKRWSEVLTHLQKTNRIMVRTPDAPALASIKALDDLRQQWGSATDVAVVSAEASELLSPDTEPSQRPEVTTAAALDDSAAIRRMRSLAEDAIATSGSSRERFWADVMEPLATEARQVTVIDRYLFKSLWDLNSGQHWTRHWRGEQLSWLLPRLCSVMGSPAEISLIGVRDNAYPGETATSTAAALRAAWAAASAGRIAQATVILASPTKIAEFPHDRHIRFHTRGALVLGAGFDRLRENTIRDADGLSWQYRGSPQAIQDLQAREQRALAFPRTEAVV